MLCERRNFLKIGTCYVVAMALPVRAQSHPSQPINIVIGLSPGGSTDTNTRLLASALSDTYNENVIVYNRPGAGSTIAAAYVAASPPDGHTVFMGTGSYSTSVVLYESLPFNPDNAFIPVTQYCRFPSAVAVGMKSGIESIQQLVDQAKKSPGAIAYASTGFGGQTHFSGELFQILTQTKLNHVPYKGGGPAMQDVIGGQVPVVFVDLPSLLPYIQSNRIRVLAITGEERSSVAPQIPTFMESGVKGFDIEGWYGLFAPAGTPESSIQALYEQVSSVCDKSGFRSKIASSGAQVVGSSPQEFAEFFKRDVGLYRSIAHTAGIKLT